MRALLGAGLDRRAAGGASRRGRSTPSGTTGGTAGSGTAGCGSTTCCSSPDARRRGSTAAGVDRAVRGAGERQRPCAGRGSRSTPGLPDGEAALPPLQSSAAHGSRLTGGLPTGRPYERGPTRVRRGCPTSAVSGGSGRRSPPRRPRRRAARAPSMIARCSRIAGTMRSGRKARVFWITAMRSRFTR